MLHQGPILGHTPSLLYHQYTALAHMLARTLICDLSRWLQRLVQVEADWILSNWHSMHLFCPHLPPHTDPLPNGCHKTHNVPWLTRCLNRTPSVCLSVCVCVCVRECVCSCHCLCEAHWETSLLSGVEMRHKGAGGADRLLPVFLQRLRSTATLFSF